jgi:hypothetical protein
MAHWYEAHSRHRREHTPTFLEHVPREPLWIGTGLLLLVRSRSRTCIDTTMQPIIVLPMSYLQSRLPSHNASQNGPLHREVFRGRRVGSSVAAAATMSMTMLGQIGLRCARLWMGTTQISRPCGPLSEPSSCYELGGITNTITSRGRKSKYIRIQQEGNGILAT